MTCTCIEDAPLRLALASLCSPASPLLLHSSRAEAEAAKAASAALRAHKKAGTAKLPQSSSSSSSSSPSSSSSSSSSSSTADSFDQNDWLTFPKDHVFRLNTDALFLNKQFRRKTKIRVNQYQVSQKKSETQHTNKQIEEERNTAVCYHLLISLLLLFILFIILYLYN